MYEIYMQLPQVSNLLSQIKFRKKNKVPQCFYVFSDFSSHIKHNMFILKFSYYLNV